MGGRETPATAKIRAELPLRGCPLHPGFCGFPRLRLGAGASYSAAQEMRIRRIGRRPRSDEGLNP